MSELPFVQVDVVLELVAEAVRLNLAGLDVEYKDGYEEVCAMFGATGFGIARFESSSAEGRSLRKGMYAIRKKPRIVEIAGQAYTIRSKVYNSFGEDAFRVRIKKMHQQTAGAGSVK